MKNYYLWRLHGENDNFIQVDNDIPSVIIFGSPKGFLRDLIVDVAERYTGARVKSLQIQ